MKNIFLTIVLVLSLNVFAGKPQEIKLTPSPYFSYELLHCSKNNSKIEKERIELIYKIPHYITPFYVYKNQFRISVTEGVKFWVEYNDFMLLQDASENKTEKYKFRISGTFRFRLPW